MIEEQKLGCYSCYPTPYIHECGCARTMRTDHLSNTTECSGNDDKGVDDKDRSDE